MTSAKAKVLFISHAASRSGAPMLLLYFLQWVRKHQLFDFQVLILHDGELRAEFESLCTVHTVQGILKSNSLLYKLNRKLSGFSQEKEIAKVVDSLLGEKYNLVYGNTVLCLPWLIRFREAGGIKTLLAVHELTYVLESFFTRQVLTAGFREIDQIIAGSEAVADNLKKGYGVNVAKLQTIHSFINTDILPDESNDIKISLGIEENAFVIGGAGTPEWRKGTDLIIPLAQLLVSKFPSFPFRVIWIGGGPADPEIRKLKYDADKCGLSSYITFVNASPRYLEYMNAFDLFLLLSREDPFPLVALEAGLLQKPMLAFDNSGGSAELLQDGGGTLVPYLNIEKLSDEIFMYFQTPSEIARAGAAGRDSVLKKYNIEIIAPRISDLINSVLN